MIRRTVFGLTLIVAALASGCGGEERTAFDDDNQAAFLAACTDQSADELVQQRVCLCVIEEAQRSISFARFEEINTLLATDPAAPLPDDIVELLARCVVEEADL